MSEPLLRARGALGRGEPELAIAELRTAWRACPAKAIADAIMLLDERMPPARVAGVASGARYEARWQRKAARGGVPLVGRFASMIDRIDRLDVMLQYAPDPRLSAAVVSILSDLRPAHTGDDADTRLFWMRCAEAVELLEDPSLVQLRDAEAPWQVAGLKVRLDVSFAALERRFPDGAPELDDGAREVLQDIDKTLSATSTRSLQRDGSERALLSAIYASPSDDGARLVYADWLIEQGRAHGELIQLQLTESRDEAATEQLDGLLRRARKRWVGPLEPIVSVPVFRRGLLAAACITWRHRGDIDRLGAHPAWSTLEEVTFRATQRGGMPQHLDATVATSLRTLRGVDETGIASLCAATQPWSIRELSAVVSTSACKRQMAATPLLPALTRLTYGGEVTASALSWLWSARLRAQLEELTVVVRSRRDLWKLQMEASRLSALSCLRVRIINLVLTLTRGPEHRLTRAVARTHDLAASGNNFVELLEMAPEYAFTHLEVHFSLSPEQLKRFDDAAARQRGLDDIVIHAEIPA